MTARCVVPACQAELPTVTRYVPLDADRYLLVTPVDQDVLRAHLLAEHSARRPALTRVRGLA